MKYTLLNRRKSIVAKNDIEFVNWMRKNDVQNWHSNKEFMDGYSHRKYTFEKIILRTEDENVFVEDLIKNNLLAIEEPRKGFFRIFN